jgi:hypothetical protein
MFELDYLVVLHKKALDYTISKISLVDGSIWSETVTLGQNDTIFGGTVSTLNEPCLILAYTLNGLLQIEYRYKKPTAAPTIPRIVKTNITDSKAVHVVSGKVIEVYVLTSRGIVKYGNNDRSFYENSYITPNTMKVQFTMMCAINNQAYALSDGKRLYMQLGELHLVKLETLDSTEIESLSCSPLGNLAVKQKSYPPKIVEYELKNTEQYLIDKRFQPNRQFQTDDNSYGIIIRTMTGLLLYKDKTATNPSATYELDSEGPEYFVKNFQTDATKNESTFSLFFHADKKVGEALKLDYKIYWMDTKPEEMELKFTREEERTPQVPLTFHEELKVSGHILDLSLDDSTQQKTGIKFEKRVRYTSKFGLSPGSIILDFDTEDDYSAVLFYNNSKSRQAIVINFYKHHTQLLDGYLLYFGGDYSILGRMRLHKSQQGLLAIVSRVETNRSLGNAYLVSYSFKTGKAGLGNEQLVDCLFDDLHGLRIKDRNQILGWDRTKHQLTLYRHPDNISDTNRAPIVQEEVNEFSIVQDSDSSLLIIYASHSQSDLNIKRYSVLKNTIVQLKVDFKLMHMFDKLYCKVHQTSVLECVFSGRKVRVARFILSETMATLDTNFPEEEYYVFKNLETEWIDFNDNYILIGGYRFAEFVPQDTFDLSGAFLYQRPSKGGKFSPFVRQLISKDEIFERVNTNNYRCQLEGDTITISGYRSPEVSIYTISDYKLSQLPKFSSREEAANIKLQARGYAENNITIPLSDLLYLPNKPPGPKPDDEDKKKPDDKTPSSSSTFLIIIFVVVALCLLAVVLRFVLSSTKSPSSAARKSDEYKSELDFMERSGLSQHTNPGSINEDDDKEEFLQKKRK